MSTLTRHRPTPLSDLLGWFDEATTGLAAGDFVRWVKQLLDLCGQIADAAGDGPVRDHARIAVDRLRRGVVAYSSVTD